MKTCIVQPRYSVDYAESEKLFQWELEAMDKCDETMDLIVFPESSDVPALASTMEQYLESRRRYTDRILEKASQTAKRCGAVLFINCVYETEKGPRNTTFAFDREGRQVGLYFKAHPTNGEVFERMQDAAYSYEHSTPTVVEIDGLRYCFLTCYDFYFYEQFAAIARQAPDIIIGCSHQRSDRQDALEMMSRFIAYNTNAYVVRSSVSMDENGTIGGSSMIVSPMGQVLLDMGSRVGMEVCDFDPRDKYYKPAGFGNPPAAHYAYIEEGRRPWNYRPGGSAITLPDRLQVYPRLCAHRGGMGKAMPENSMPAYGAAIAQGAQEIEFDLWPTADGQIVSIHDKKLDRVSNGTGLVCEHTLEELKKLDFGKDFSEEYRGLGVVTFQKILEKFACHAIMNIHLKTLSNDVPYDETALKKIISMIREYDCEKYVYFMSGNDHVLRQLGELAPDLPRCVGGGKDPDHVVERAIEMGCQKVQFFKPHFSKEKIELAHKHGIRCNMFWSNDPQEAREMLEMGIDTILTDRYLLLEQALEDVLPKKWSQELCGFED